MSFPSINQLFKKTVVILNFFSLMKLEAKGSSSVCIKVSVQNKLQKPFLVTFQIKHMISNLVRRMSSKTNRYISLSLSLSLSVRKILSTSKQEQLTCSYVEYRAINNNPFEYWITSEERRQEVVRTSDDRCRGVHSAVQVIRMSK